MFNALGLDPLMGQERGRRHPIYQPIMINGEPVPFYFPQYETEEKFKEAESLGMLPTEFNLYKYQKDQDKTRNYRTYRYNLTLDYKILEFLKLSVRGMYEENYYTSRSYDDKYTFNSNYNINKFTNIVYIGGVPQADRFVPIGGFLKLNESRTKSYTLRSQVNYDYSLGAGQINAVAGIEFRESDYENRNREEFGYDDMTGTWPTIDLESLSSGVKTYWRSSSSYRPKNFVRFNKRRYASYYMNAAYTYNKKYTLTLSGRVDDGSMFGVSANKRRRPLWSVGGSWNLNKESFFNFDFVNMLKLRLTYGKNGNVSSNLSSFTTFYYAGETNWRTLEPIASISTRRNPNLKWETTRTINTAIDFDIFNHKLHGTIELYDKYTNDVLSNFAMSPVYGINSRTFNNGEISNRGITIQLQSSIGNKFKWTPGINFSHNKNKVIKTQKSYNNAVTFLKYQGSSAPVVGHSITETYGYEFAGIDDKGDPTVYIDGKVVDHLSLPEDLTGN